MVRHRYGNTFLRQQMCFYVNTSAFDSIMHRIFEFKILIFLMLSIGLPDNGPKHHVLQLLAVFALQITIWQSQ